MVLTDFITESNNEYEIYFLLTAYLESLRFGDKFGLLSDRITRLPLNGMPDVRKRFEALLGELEKQDIWSSSRAIGFLREALHVFGTGLLRLTQLGIEQPSPAGAPRSGATPEPLSVFNPVRG
jgi:hypothetical protein